MAIAKNSSGIKILCFDIELCPIEAYVWSLWDQNIGLNQIKVDSSVLSFAAKWVGDKKSEMVYADTFLQKNQRDDKAIIQKLWKLFDEADIILGQNSDSFDIKIANARFLQHGLPPPRPYITIDTKKMAKSAFRFTSNKLEYMSDKLCTKYKKYSHKKFPGMSLWTEFLARNPEAQREMRVYNEFDVLSTEELYLLFRPWYKNHPNINLHKAERDLHHSCPSCGSKNLQRRGERHTLSQSFARFQCNDCHSWSSAGIKGLTRAK